MNINLRKLLEKVAIPSLTAKVGSGALLFLFFSLPLFAQNQDRIINPVIDYHIILCVGMVVVYCLGGFERLSLYGRWSELSLVRRFTILQ